MAECLEGKGYYYTSVANCQADVTNFNPTYPYFTGDDEVCLATKYNRDNCMALNNGYTSLEDCAANENLYGNEWLSADACMAAEAEYASLSACLADKGAFVSSIDETWSDTNGDTYSAIDSVTVSNPKIDYTACYPTLPDPYTSDNDCLAQKYGITDLDADEDVDRDDCLASQPYKNVADCIANLPDNYDQCYADLNGTTEKYYRMIEKDVNPTGMLRDGAIGQVSWDMMSFVGQNLIGVDEWTKSTAVDAETVLFWYELKQAGLIGDITDAGIKRSTTRYLFGEVYPASELGGGFWVAHSDGCCGGAPEVYNEKKISTGRPYIAGPFTLNGNILVLTKFPTGSREQAPSDAEQYKCSQDMNGTTTCDYKYVSDYMLNLVPKDNVISPAEAKQVDLKLDDGFPATGFVQAYGETDSCYKSFNGGFVYDERITGKHCGLYIKITE